MTPTAVVVPVVQDATDFCIILINGKLARSSHQWMEGRATPCHFSGPSTSVFSLCFNLEQTLHLAHLFAVPEGSSRTPQLGKV